MCIEWFKSLFIQPKVPVDPTFPTSTGKIKGEEVWQIMNNVLNCDTKISDEEYETCSMEAAKKYLESYPHKQPYILEGHDCDNYSFAAQGYFSEGLWSFPFGIIWSRPHAFNFFVDDKKQVWIVEPQTNEFMTVAQAKAKSLNDGMYYPIEWAMC